ncbi:MAG: hypothetical protein ACFFAJ_16660 [Candidatus Hodarchaeota archaeon]
MSTLTLWKISKSIHEEIYFKTELRTGTASKVETIEKYQKNLKFKRRMALLSNLLFVYIIGVVSIIPLFALLNFLVIKKEFSNINQLLFVNSVIFGIYNLYVFFILFMGGLMTYVTFMKGEYFKLLYPLTLSPSQLTQISFFVFIRMNMIQVIFILLALPIASFIITLNPLIFLIIFLNNLVNTFFIIFILIIISWFLAQKIFNTSERTRWGSLITILSMIVYSFTVIPIFLLMSQLLNIIMEIFSLSLESGITTETNILLSLIPFPMSSGYLTSIILSNSLNLIPFPLLISSIIGSGLLFFLIIIVIIKGLNLIKKLNMEIVIRDKKQTEVDDIPITVKNSHPVIETIKMNLILVFRDYTSLMMFVLAILFPFLIVIMSIIFPQRYIDMGGGVLGFLVTMLSFSSGMIATLFFAGTKISERNLGDIYGSLPLREMTLFRSKQIIVTCGLVFPLLFAFIVSNLIRTPIPYLTGIKLLLTYLLIGTELILVNTLLYGSFNHRYTLTVENNDHAFLKLAILILVLFLTIIGYNTFIDIITASLSLPELPVTLFIAVIFYFVLELISWKIFRVEGFSLGLDNTSKVSP